MIEQIQVAEKERWIIVAHWHITNLPKEAERKEFNKILRFRFR
jgi:hypothetical protein